MSDPAISRRFPRGILYAAGAMIAFTISAAALVRGGVVEPVAAPAIEVLESREIRFVDRADGAVVVYDTGRQDPISVMEIGTNGFVRGALRGLARQRKLNGISAEPPFLLTRWADGSLSLEDTATGERLYLEAFGPTQVATFEGLLDAETTQ